MSQSKGISNQAQTPAYRNSEEWQLVDAVACLRRTIRWWPGTGSAWFMGAGNLLPLMTWIVSLANVVSGYGEPGPHLAIPHGFSLVFIILHAASMFCMTQGYAFGQRLVGVYYGLASIVSFSFVVYAVYAGQPVWLQYFVFSGFLSSLFMCWFSTTKGFFKYSEIMRIKRIYYQEREHYFAEIIKQSKEDKKRKRRK